MKEKLKKLSPQQQARANRLARMTPTEWEAICKHCGVCCLIKLDVDFEQRHAKSVDGMGTLYLKRCCNHFNTKNKCCEIYQTRLQAPGCCKVDMDIILAGKLLPASCGYVEYIFGPAPFPANVDFDQVRPIDDADVARMTIDGVGKEMILESVFWNLRQR